MKSCPFCAEEIQDAAIKCGHCGEFLDASRRPRPAEKTPPRLFPGAIMALFVLAATLLYGHTLHAPWYFDDHSAILDNPVVHDLGRAVAGLGQPRGVSFLSFALNYRFCGTEVVCYHLTNIALHLLCAGLVYRLLCRIFAGRFWPILGALFFSPTPCRPRPSPTWCSA